MVAWRREQAQLLRETNLSQTKDSYYTEISRPFAGILQYSLMGGWRTFMWARAQIVNKFRKNPFLCPWDFEEQNKFLESSIIIVNCCIIVINACYK
jgi:hypothetical protein